jgi:hypothetical protein
MNVLNPARSVFPSLDAPVLLALHEASRPATGRRVAALAGGSPTAVNAILARLCDAGVVLAERQGSAVLYEGNRSHVAWVVVEALAGMRAAVLAAVRTELSGWAVAPLTGLAVTTLARDPQDEDADLDLLLVRPTLTSGTEAAWEQQKLALRAQVMRVAGNDCQILDLDLGQLRSRFLSGDDEVTGWLREGLLLAGEPLILDA